MRSDTPLSGSSNCNSVRLPAERDLGFMKKRQVSLNGVPGKARVQFEYEFENGSVESTHKVPTSHYHTKHRLALRSRRSVDIFTLEYSHIFGIQRRWTLAYERR
jgi:hypothetical protein